MTAVLVVSVGRITPAYAGKRRCGRRNGLCVQDHPRLCGEKKDRPPFSGCRLGSPPPMRGKVRNYNQRKGTSRITPAYAGKSGIRKDLAHRHRDHPRLCGEKPVFTAAKRRCVLHMPAAISTVRFAFPATDSLAFLHRPEQRQI